DYDTLISYSKNNRLPKSYDQKNVAELLGELKNGELTNRKNFPTDVVRIDSRVRVEDQSTRRILELMLVLPEKADLGSGKVSVMAPVGVALLGYRQGEEISWQVPAGRKHFKIVEVKNPAMQE
ncbi:MAG TPA: GreA/GreB family elongation factor, partial [Puia sp.]|nr:GreA/GreB family elongation factor [Puia sp.]